MERPLVSILCLCYNHELYVDEALASIASLSYPNLEIRVADDASTDQSVKKLRVWKERHPGWHFVFQHENKGNCKTFNGLLAQATGKYILDFATDDRLLPHSLEAWVEVMEASPNAAFCYADAWIFGKYGTSKVLFSRQNSRMNWPSGDVLKELFGRPFICPPAVLFRKSALDSIGGYNEKLAYEDWDAWLRLARRNNVVHHPYPVIEYRQHSQSLSASLFQKRNGRILDSTLMILSEVLEWNETKCMEENAARFIRYHLKLAALLQLAPQTIAFWHLLKSVSNPTIRDWFWYILSRTKFPVYWIAKHMKRSLL